MSTFQMAEEIQVNQVKDGETNTHEDRKGLHGLYPAVAAANFWHSNTETKNIILLSMVLKFWCTYCRGTVGNMFLIAVARASTIASTS